MDIPVDRPITKENQYKICFVCLGNICRSPTAEGVLQHLINNRGLENYFEVDSAGTSAYHIGESADERSQRTANNHGISLDSQARRFKASDLEYFDLILAMDNQNLKNVQQLANKAQMDKIGQMRDFDPKPGNGEVPDPYQGGREGFENVFQIVKRSCEHLLDELEKQVQT